MSEWKEYKLGELISMNAKSTGSNFPFSKIEYLDTGSITRGKIEGYQSFNIAEAPSRAKRLLKANDIIYSTVRPIQRHYGIIKNPKENLVVSTGFAVLSCDLARANPDFIYYFVTQNDIVNYLDTVAEGSTSAYPSLTPDVITNLDILLPSLQEQVQIANILSSIDDKIDLLHRQNKTLEQLAETLFREWFVEEAEGWAASRLENWILFDPREKLDKQKTYQMFEMKCLSNTDMSIGEGIFRKVSSATTFRNGDTLLAKITPCLENGKTGFVMHLEENEIAKGSTEFIVMRTKGEVSPYWIYCLARYKDFHDSAILSMTGTSGRQRVQTDLLKSYEVKVDLPRMKEFHNSVEPFFNKIRSNTNQIRTLDRLRDTLLPKLMSGEIRIVK